MRKRKSKEIIFKHIESDEEIPLSQIPLIEELLADMLFDAWLKEREKGTKKVKETEWLNAGANI